MNDPAGVDVVTEAFVTHRNLLFTVAYELLGSAADAEDVLQETWLRWAGVDVEAVRDHRAYLVRIVTSQALGHLRRLGRRKESYVGPWLPEPLLTSPDVADDVELDLRRLLGILAPDVVLLTDGGGVVRAALAPIVGADEVARVLCRLHSTVSLEPAQVNGHPALIARQGGELDSVLALRVDGSLITGLYAVRNPEKLSRMDRVTALRR
ncbi:sigma factor [Nonomuraea sp. NPDC052634]|jgi:RNA polymerase sigma-70 factor (ECF subfamily)|uniref:sigma factor n=1 Tax=Nonomuraea sp. NPDC052634 TaxID=3155813 RepID=UPI003419F013